MAGLLSMVNHDIPPRPEARGSPRLPWPMCMPRRGFDVSDFNLMVRICP